MSVQIAIEDDLTLFHELLDRFPRVPNAREGFFEYCFVVSIQISTCKRTSIVSDDHTVRIQHGNDLEHKVVPQKLKRKAKMD